MRVTLPHDYKPSDAEPFMNALQQEYFRQKLLRWRDQLVRESTETLSHLQQESLNEPDITDRASLETDRALELRTRDRARKLISKIDEALKRIEDGSYGFCEETAQPIGLKRLEARPIATLSIEAQERHERQERQYRDD
ncbi:DnaK suppressor protein [Constrictibacter sp. MBR-5]|jgi:DnaK suppressor protein|uniref:RNA polymerase-binding protein DksA n=1 Tax=Constrictibacter sp. MBR-5 TaxID=3156467 RepID=UPI0033971D9F